MVKKIKGPWFSLGKIITAVLLAILIIAVVVLTFVLKITRDQLNDASTVKIAQLIVTAVDNLVQPVPVDAQTGDRYIQPVRLRLPASSQFEHQLLYTYVAPTDDLKEELNIASRSAVGIAKSKVLGGNDFQATFDAVPEFQACTRGFRLTFEADIDNETALTFDKKLSDGRTVFVYADSGCNINRESMTSYLQNIDSY